MNLQEFIEDVEACNFRTGHDTGANPCALSVWNSLRAYAGLERLTQDDLIQRHADDHGISLDEMKEEYQKFYDWKALYLHGH